MTTALAARPTPRIERRAGVLRRIGGLRQTSPGRLQLLIAALVALGLLDDHAHVCLMGAGEDRDAKTEELMAAVGRLMRRG